MNPATDASPRPSLGEAACREMPLLYRVARRMALDPTTAEDLVSQTLVKAHQNWSHFDGRHLRSWLIAIMRNEWSNMRRRFASRPETALEDAGEPSDEGFWRQVSSSLEAEAILDALDSLPEDYRLAVALCDVEETTYEEAAQALGIPIGTIRSRVFRGRKLLRSRLASLSDDLENTEK